MINEDVIIDIQNAIIKYMNSNLCNQNHSETENLEIFFKEYRRIFEKLFYQQLKEIEQYEDYIKETAEIYKDKDLIYFEIPQINKEKICIRKCKYCGKYFILTHNRAVSCTRIVEGTGKTCRELGSNKLHTKQAQQQPELKLYYREYKRRYNYCLSRNLSKEPFFIWAKEARLMRKKCIDGKISLDEFSAWLKE
ncbi:MAG: DUF6076 domain-containing protein [Clostridiales bacterium]